MTAVVTVSETYWVVSVSMLNDIFCFESADKERPGTWKFGSDGEGMKIQGLLR